MKRSGNFSAGRRPSIPREANASLSIVVIYDHISINSETTHRQIVASSAR